jgi:hypothetical protein
VAAKERSVGEKVYDAYDSGWAAMMDRSSRIVGEGNRNLARVLALLGKPSEESQNTKLLSFYGHRIAGKRVHGVKDHAYEHRLFSQIVQRELSRAIDADTVNIIELGSGYSRNLFDIWLNGGPLEANYIGMEYTKGGRDCGTFLATLEPNMRYQSHEFDYYKPALPAFDRNAKTFVFSCYSIEQIPELGLSVFDMLLDIPGLYRVVHIEPVGWQTGPKFLPFPTELMLWGRTLISARKMRYNTNLMAVIKGLVRAGKISLAHAPKVDYLAHRPNLPGSVIGWSPRR